MRIRLFSSSLSSSLPPEESVIVAAVEVPIVAKGVAVIADGVEEPEGETSTQSHLKFALRMSL